MRIAIAHESIDTEGGVETYLVSIIVELRKRGHQIALLYHRRNGSVGPMRANAHMAACVEELGLEPAMAELRAWQPEVCYSHNMGPLEVDRALIAEWPVVKMLHGFFGTCVSGLKMHAFPSPRVCGRTFGPACLALYFPRRCGQLSLAAMRRGYRWANEQRALFPRYASIVVASRFMRDEVSRHGVPGDRVDVMALFPTLQAGGTIRSAEKDLVLFAGRMTSLKGGHVLVAAVARASRTLNRPVRLLMAGDGPQKEAWRERASSLGVDAEFTGWIRDEHRAEVYSRAGLVVMPSLWPEPFGLSGLDAAAVGRPAVAFDVGGIGEWLADGVNGLLVDPAAGEAGLASAIVSLLDQPAERERMAAEALNVARRMTVAAHVDALEPALRRGSLVLR
jgi:glycosyltransferase involved in cell wall biosynthesis